MMPIIENIVGSDRLPGARDGGQVLLSALGDDAVVLGAVALARKLVGRSPFKSRFVVMPQYAKIVCAGFGEIIVGKKSYDHDIYIGVNGKVKDRDRSRAKERYGDAHTVGPKELEKVCEGGPAVLFVGAGKDGELELTEDARRYLGHRAIRCEVLPTPSVAEAYNQCNERKAVLVHVTC
jgi:hypothetical protein